MIQPYKNNGGLGSPTGQKDGGLDFQGKYTVGSYGQKQIWWSSRPWNPKDYL